MPIKKIARVHSSIQPNDHPYMTGAWTPNYDEFNATDMEVIGEIPRDVDGVYLRNTENPVHEPIGRYHPFDGDGMIHMISLANGNAEYRNRFVRTKAFIAEREAGHSLWAGLMEPPQRSLRKGWGAHGQLKDSSSTDVIVHAGKVLSTFYQCGEGYRLDPFSLDSLGTESWVPAEGISAHPKLDERTGELLFFNYSKNAPYFHYGVVGADNKLKHYTPIAFPGPRLPHDIAFSENYTIVNDLPVFWDPELLQRGVHASRFFPEIPSRFGILPRFGNAESVVWFEAKPTYVLHWLNAWEDGDEVVLDGYFQEEPVPGNYPNAPRGMERMMAFLDQHLLKPRLHRWRFNMTTGQTLETHLDDKTLEFGTINQRYCGRRNRYSYSSVPKQGMFLFTGATKHDHDNDRSWSIDFGPGRYGSEPGFAPRIGATAEDDGYLVTFVSDMNLDRSECLLLDASDIEAGPVCRIVLPHRISSGTHSTWAHGEAIRKSG
jgi:carotenoid cleavage dioxygenase-like enzyme